MKGKNMKNSSKPNFKFKTICLFRYVKGSTQKEPNFKWALLNILKLPMKNWHNITKTKHSKYLQRKKKPTKLDNHMTWWKLTINKELEEKQKDAKLYQKNKQVAVKIWTIYLSAMHYLGHHPNPLPTRTFSSPRRTI